MQLSTLTPVGRLEEELHMLLEVVPAGIHLADTADLGERLRIRDFDHNLLGRTAAVAADSLPVAGSRRRHRRHTVVAAVADIHPVDTLLQMLLVKRCRKKNGTYEFSKHQCQFKVQ